MIARTFLLKLKSAIDKQSSARKINNYPFATWLIWQSLEETVQLFISLEL